MPYEPTEWKSGDVVTSAKLNKLEAGIASGGVLVVTDTEGTLDKTWQEIHDAAYAVIRQVVDDNTYYVLPLTRVGLYNGVYLIQIGDSYSPLLYITDSASGYPVFEENPGTT